MLFRIATISTAVEEVIVIAVFANPNRRMLAEGFGHKYGAFVGSTQFLSAVQGQTFKFRRKKFVKPEARDANVANGSHSAAP